MHEVLSNVRTPTHLLRASRVPTIFFPIDTPLSRKSLWEAYSILSPSHIRKDAVLAMRFVSYTFSVLSWPRPPSWGVEPSLWLLEDGCWKEKHRFGNSRRPARISLTLSCSFSGSFNPNHFMFTARRKFTQSSSSHMSCHQEKSSATKIPGKRPSTF